MSSRFSKIFITQCIVFCEMRTGFKSEPATFPGFNDGYTRARLTRNTNKALSRTFLSLS